MAANVGEVLFDANTEKKDALTHEEIWDDTILIQQYDAALARVRKKINNRLGTTEDEQSAMTSDREDKSQKKKKKGKKKNKWRVGDFCRARFSQDGGVYEASIVSLKTENNKVVVRYVGYNNEEEVSLRSLMKSQGQEARRYQEELADDGQSEVSDFGSSVLESDMQSDTDGERSSKARESSSHPPRPQQMRMPPPSFYGSNTQFNPPPYLPDLPPPPALAMDISDDPRTSEALHTMLMSWYMTGYHTGYYQGLKQTESQKDRRK